jgi:hypothetical protein
MDGDHSPAKTHYARSPHLVVAGFVTAQTGPQSIIMMPRGEVTTPNAIKVEKFYEFH